MKELILSSIKIYKYIGSPLLHYVLPMPLKSGCRFYPPCSDYAIEVVKKYGAWKGFSLLVIRVLKCNPFGQINN